MALCRFQRWTAPALVRLFVCFLLLATAVAASDGTIAARDDTITRIAFGSCSKVEQPQPLWDVMLKREPLPSVFMWGGDNVYADTRTG